MDLWRQLAAAGPDYSALAPISAVGFALTVALVVAAGIVPTRKQRPTSGNLLMAGLTVFALTVMTLAVVGPLARTHSANVRADLVTAYLADEHDLTVVDEVTLDVHAPAGEPNATAVALTGDGEFVDVAVRWMDLTITPADSGAELPDVPDAVTVTTYPHVSDR